MFILSVIVLMLILALFAAFIIWLIKALTGGGSSTELLNKARQESATLSREEAGQMRRMDEALERMEARIANLETILVHKEKEAPYEKLG